METKVIHKNLIDKYCKSNFNFSSALIKAKHLEDILEIVDRILVDFIKVDAYRFILLDSNGNKPKVVKSRGIKEDELEVDFNKEVINTVIATGEPFITIDIDSLEIVNQPYGKTLVCLPLECQERIIGLIEIRRLKENESINFDKYIILLKLIHLIAINRTLTQIKHLCENRPILWHRRVKEYVRSLIF
ncbi:MAG: hypothetical protein AB1567_04150 [bacterium]